MPRQSHHKGRCGSCGLFLPKDGVCQQCNHVHVGSASLLNVEEDSFIDDRSINIEGFIMIMPLLQILLMWM